MRLGNCSLRRTIRCLRNLANPELQRTSNIGKELNLFSMSIKDANREDVNKAQILGCHVSPRFLEVLREASGRQR
jgi:hypothetical protein